MKESNINQWGRYFSDVVWGTFEQTDRREIDHIWIF